jgi:hypothetical protein
MKINKTTKEELDYVKDRTGPKPDSKKPIQPKKPKTRSK